MLVGCDNWVITLWRFCVHASVSTMGRYNATLRKVHLGVMNIVVCYPMEHWIICDTKLL